MENKTIIPADAICEIALLTKEEARDIPQSVLEFPYCWWLRSPGKHVTNVATVCYFGCVLTRGHSVTLPNYAVRPALRISPSFLRDLNIGDAVFCVGRKWQYVGGNLLLLSEEPLACMAFHRDAEEYERWDDEEKYEKSDVCRYLQAWLEEQKADNR